MVELCHELGQLDGTAGDPAPAQLAELFSLFEVDHVSQASLRTPVQSRAAYAPPPLDLEPVDPGVLNALRAQLQSSMESQITPAKVRDYLAPYLKQHDPIQVAELPIRTVDDWLMVIGLHAYSTMADSPYQCLPPPESHPWVDVGAFRCRNIQFASQGVSDAHQPRRVV